MVKVIFSTLRMKTLLRRRRRCTDVRNYWKRFLGRKCTRRGS
jgi:hypothetical protein